MKKIIIASIVAVTLAAITAIYALGIQHEPVKIQKQIYESCVLQANNDYTDKIKLFGTPVVIDGKSYDSLSSEQWRQLNDDRLSQIDRC